MSRLIDADAIVYESIDSCDTRRHEHYYGTGIIGVRKEDIDEMPTIQPEPHWIPVTERLPKKSGVYTVTDHKGDVVRFVFNAHSDSSLMYWYRCAKAWMPLPEPWKGE